MSRKLAMVLLVLWASVGTVVGGVLLLRHMALRVPGRADTQLRTAVAAALPRASGRPGAVHVMYRECPCSARTIAHLLERSALTDTDELVLIVDDDGAGRPDDRDLLRAGYRVRVITPAALHTEFHIEAAPVLVVVDGDGSLAYVGGYSAQKTTKYDDIAIIRGVTSAPLPVFGCATSERLARSMDPLGLEPKKTRR